ncbi:MAG: penicillin-binding protein 2 [Gammaproteobacteria bacterium]|nr:penicillin-binding protein 2 [Gammaproteobacteria bacterium]
MAVNWLRRKRGLGRNGGLRGVSAAPAPARELHDRNKEQHTFNARAAISMVLVAAAFLVLFGRMVQLQVFEADAYRARSDNNRVQTVAVAPRRGLIYDRNGQLLAGNRTIHSIAVVTELARNIDALLEEVGALVPLGEADVAGFHKRLKAKRRPLEPIPLKLNINEQERATVRVNEFRLPGVQVRADIVRHYPEPLQMTHAIGSVRRIDETDLERLDEARYAATAFIGRHGVEQFYEDSLHGEPGHRRIETDARGRQVRTLFEQPARAGADITLHLDASLQRAAADALGDRRGAVVAIEPRTGGILALLSQPGYDANLFVTGISAAQYHELKASRETPLFNRATRGLYAPGSTFKPVMGLAGVSHGVTTWEDTVNDRGSFRINGEGRVYRDWSWQPGNSGGQGIVNLHRAIYRSSNVYFYSLGSELNIDDLASFAGQFGYGRNTTVDIAFAQAGVLPSRDWKRGALNEAWYPGDTVNLAIGQGFLLATPLQLAAVTATIANRGHPVRPRLLLSSDGEVRENDPPPPLPAVAGPTPEDWERMVDAMEAVVHRGNKGYQQNGTAWFYIGQDDIPYRMAGKSGTAQVVGIPQGEEYDEEALDEFERKHAWFIAFAPADDPRIALSVLVENGGGGSSVAAPVARAVLDSYLLDEAGDLKELPPHWLAAGAATGSAGAGGRQPRRSVTLKQRPTSEGQQFAQRIADAPVTAR